MELCPSGLIDLSQPDIANDLTSRLDRPLFKQVIEADIISALPGTSSHSQDIDEGWVKAGKPPYANRAAATIFLHSLTHGVASGADLADINLAVLEPGNDAQLLKKALERLVNTCWFLSLEQRYRFSTEKQLPKVIEEEKQLIGKSKAKGELEGRIKQLWKKGTFMPVFFPSESGDVDDDAREPKLVIIHFDAATARAQDTKHPGLVLQIFEYSGTAQKFREFKNNLLFLVADTDQIDNMVDVAQKYLAVCRIVDSPDRLKEFPEEQRRKLKEMKDSGELQVRIAITKAYRFVYYPDASASHNLARETLTAQEQGEVEKDQSMVVLRLLKQQDKVLTEESNTLPSAFVKSKAWPQSQESMDIEELREKFARQTNLKMLLDINQLKKTIKEGIANSTWIYYVPEEKMGYGKNSPAPAIQIKEGPVLYTPEDAKKKGIKLKGEEPQLCPLCSKPREECICAKVCLRCGKEPCVCQGKVVIRAEGTPQQAFQAIKDQCQDAKISKLKYISVHCEGMDKEGAAEARALGLAVPQLGKAQFNIQQDMVAELGKEENFTVAFKGNWDRYSKKLKGVVEDFGKEASKLNIKTNLKIEFPDGLAPDSPRLQTMSDVFTQLQMGKLVVEAE